MTMDDPESEIRTMMDEAIRLHSSGALEQAEQIYQDVLKRRRSDPDGHYLLGVLMFQRGEPAKAIRFIRRAMTLRPGFADAVNSLAGIYIKSGDLKAAVDLLQQELSAHGEKAALLRTLAGAQTQSRNLAAAADTYQRLHDLNPDDNSILRGWAAVLLDLERFEEAARMYDLAIDVDPAEPVLKCYKAQAIRGQGRYEDALAILDGVLAAQPDFIPALVHSGMTLQMLGDVDRSIERFRDVIRRQPDHAEAHFNLGVSLLTLGQYAEGWEEYAWRFRMEAFKAFRPPVKAPLWAGEPLAGKKILIFAEQGLGDTINFARYATPLHEMGAEVHCLCGDVVADVVATIDGVHAVHGYNAPVPVPDYQISMMELPHAFESTPDTIPGKGGYVRPPKDAFRPDAGFNVGIIWQGNLAHRNDAFRSVPLARFDRLLDTPGVNFFSLQVREGTHQIADLGWQARLRDLSAGIVDFSDSADIMSKLDLVISVDTAPAHLAGALGRPVWLLLPTVADWRWTRSGETSCWYESMRIFRQGNLGDWESVFAKLEAELSALVATAT